MQITHSKPILPGVPTPAHLDNTDSKKILPGVGTPIQERTYQEVDTKMQQVWNNLERQYDRLHPPKLPQGHCGGPGTIHPNAFRSELYNLMNFFFASKSEDPKTQGVIDRAKVIFEGFLPIYEEYVGQGIHFGESNRYVNANGDTISKEQFDHTVNQYEAFINRAAH